MNLSKAKPPPPTAHYLSRLIRYAGRVPPIALLLLILIFFNKMAFSNLILARGDTFRYFYPYWQAAATALRHGRIPLWNPHLFMGAPFLANSQAGFFYPLNWPLWLLLPVPYAVSVTILLHLFIAGCGAYLAGRHCLSLGKGAAWLTAVLFALGGYLTAQVEHVNQLQGLAWLPWFLVVVDYTAAAKDKRGFTVVARATAAFALLFALQLLAGHTQTAFITGTGVLIWGIAQLATHFLTKSSSYALHFTFFTARLRKRLPVALVVGGALALALTAAQLFPTLALAQLSSRQGGLPANEVLSFSLHPLLLARALLPAYGQSLFSEYTAFLPLIAIVLAFAGGWQWRQWRGVLPAVALAAVGLFLALGYFNPLYWLLARLPPFNLFRVPARWLVLYALGMALLAGVGWQIAWDRWLVHTREWTQLPERAQERLWHVERPLRIALFILIALMVWNVIAAILAIFIPTGPEAPYEIANPLTVVLWNAELVAAYLLLSGQRLIFAPQARFRFRLQRTRPGWPLWLAAFVLLLLFAASRSQPYNNLTTPAAYFELRPPLARLQTAALMGTSPQPPGRFLSLSNIHFDLGDQAEIDAIYADQLPPAALYDYTVATKQKEVVDPNLPLAYGLASVDGFDGGILPPLSYSQLTQLILPPGTAATDGRLREHLTAVPEARWLDLFNARYIITDKTGDQWREEVFFDLQHAVTIAPQETVSVGYVPDFVATALLMIASGEVGHVEVVLANGERWQAQPVAVAEDVWRAEWPPNLLPAAAHAISLHGGNSGSWQVAGLTLVNETEETFHAVVLGNYRLVHSGDVKIYENLDVMPRAFMVHQWQWQPDETAVLTVMDAPGFDVGQTAVLMGQGPAAPAVTGPPGQVAFIHYGPERVVLRTDSDAVGLVVLADAYYPGWKAAVDQEPVPVYQVDGLFRGVMVPAGEHQITFFFTSRPLQVGWKVTLAGVAFLALLIIAPAFIALRYRHVRE